MALLGHLQGIPLAIVMTGSHMRKTRMSVNNYLKFYEQSWHRLQSHANPGREHYQGNLHQTLFLSFDAIRKRDAYMAEMLILLAHFDNRDIWYELVKSVEHSSSQPMWFTEVLSDRLIFKERMRTLIEFSLIGVNKETGSYTMHRLVQDWCLNMARTENDVINSPWEDLALVAIGHMIPAERNQLIGSYNGGC
jgi:hypothetical protein